MTNRKRCGKMTKLIQANEQLQQFIHHDQAEGAEDRDDQQDRKIHAARLLLVGDEPSLGRRLHIANSLCYILSLLSLRLPGIAKRGVAARSQPTKEERTALNPSNPATCAVDLTPYRSRRPVNVCL